MNIECMYFFQFWFPPGIYLEVVLLGYMVVLFLIFKRISILSFIVAVSLYIPTRSARRFPFLASLVAQRLKRLPPMRETWVRSLGQEDPLEKVMATHSSVLAWRIPGTGGAWWAAIYGVTQSQTRPKWLSSSSNQAIIWIMPIIFFWKLLFHIKLHDWQYIYFYFYHHVLVFPGGSVVKNLPANAGDASSVPEIGRSPGEGNGNPLQYSCLENPMDRGAWWVTVPWDHKRVR